MATTVCVTGANGFIGSWIVHFLLARGYRVRGTVQNIKNEEEYQHLMNLEGAKENLSLFEADLLNYEDIATAIGNSGGVFHVASPCSLEQAKDPKKELIDPAVEGTLNVLKASHAAGVKRVVVTSSVSAMYPNPKLPPGTIVDENSWTDIEYCKERECWYPVSKVLAEKAAWKFSKETGLDVVAINPGCVFGYSLQPTLNASTGVLLNLIRGVPDKQELTWLGIVHVRDVAQAHILLYETPEARGRYLCTNEIIHFSDLAEEVAEMYPEYNVCRFEEETHPGLVRMKNAAKKLLDLGFVFTSGKEAIKDTVASLQDKGFLHKQIRKESTT